MRNTLGSGALTRLLVHVPRREPAREDVDRARGVDRLGRENVQQEQLPFRDRVHGDVTVVEEEYGGEAACLALTHRRYAWRVHPGGARRGDDQSADERAIRELISGDADKVGDDVHVVAGQARRDTGASNAA